MDLAGIPCMEEAALPVLLVSGTRAPRQDLGTRELLPPVALLLTRARNSNLLPLFPNSPAVRCGPLKFNALYCKEISKSSSLGDRLFFLIGCFFKKKTTPKQVQIGKQRAGGGGREAGVICTELSGEENQSLEELWGEAGCKAGISREAPGPGCQPACASLFRAEMEIGSCQRPASPGGAPQA